MNRSKRIAQIICITVAASMILGFLLGVVVELPWLLPAIAVAAAGGFLFFRLRAKGAKGAGAKGAGVKGAKGAGAKGAKGKRR